MPVSTRTSAATLLLSIPVLLAALSGCAAPAAPPGPTVSPSAAERPDAFASFEDYQLALFACLREEGIDVTDPSGGGQNITRTDDAFLAAIETCRIELGPPPAQEGAESGSETADTLREEQLRIAECLRDEGVAVDDPPPGGDLEIPADVPSAAFAACAPGGVGGVAGVRG
jgi:hypothetical protein